MQKFTILHSQVFLALLLLTLQSACVGNIPQPFSTVNGQGQSNANPLGDPNALGSSTTSGTNSSGGTTTVNVPFEPLTPTLYVSKIKKLLIDQAPTSSEVTQVESNPASLRDLLSTWMQGAATNQLYQNTMLNFFNTAFQQSPANQGTLLFSYFGATPFNTANFTSSYAQTVMATVNADKPFNTVMNTSTFLLNVPMMMYLAQIDSYNSNYGAVGQPSSCFQGNVYIEDSTPIAFNDSINPASPNYGIFYDVDMAQGWTAAQRAACTVNNRIPLYASADGSNCNATSYIMVLINGIRYGAPDSLYISGSNGAACYAATPVFPNLLTPTDLAMRMVTIRQPKPGEAPLRFYDLPTMRTANEIVLSVPRVGFFTQPAFLAQWLTNASNQARVTINQAMIVALNQNFDGSSQATAGMDMSSLDANHTAANPGCYTCHQTMDPMRQFYLKQFNYNFQNQTDPNFLGRNGWFDIQGVSTAGTSVYDLANDIANHPKLAAAWVQKMCVFANAVPCNEADPVFKQIANNFASNFSWNTMVQDLFSSPLVTLATPTLTTQTNLVQPGITRANLLCANLNTRLNLTNVCGGSTVSTLVQGLPGDNYVRNTVTLPLVTQPSLTYATDTENICKTVATQVVDNGSTSLYSSKDPNAAIENMVSNLMGLASDGNNTAMVQEVTQTLQNHYQNAINPNISKTVALQSTFVLACLSPATLGIGIGL